MTNETTQARLEALRQNVAARRARADARFAAYSEAPATQKSPAFSFVNSIHNDGADLPESKRARIKAIMDSLSEREQTTTRQPEPQLADTGLLASPMVAGQPRGKATILT